MNTLMLLQKTLQLRTYRGPCNTRLWTVLFLIALIILVIYNIKNSQNLYCNNEQKVHLSSESVSSKTNRETLSKILVVSRFNEDISWIDLYLGNKLPHIVYTRLSDVLAINNFYTTKGREAVLYLRYIVDYYENLPSLIAFVHGHRTSKHQTNPSDIVVALRAVRWNKYAYMPLTSSRTVSFFKLGTENMVTTVNFELWRDVLQKELGPPPDSIDTHCCGTFIVRREAVLKHPRTFYLRILEYIITTHRSELATSQTLEFVWHIMFGEKPQLKYETCDIFFCDSNETVSVDLAERQSH